MGENTPEEMMQVAEFGKLKGISAEKVVDMIRDGFYVGRKVGEEWFIDELELQGNNNKHTSNEGVNNSNRQIIFGVILVAIGFLIYANGEQLGLTLLGGEDQIMRDMMNGAMFDKGYTNRASSIGNFLQGLYIVVIAIGSIMVLLGLAKSKK